VLEKDGDDNLDLSCQQLINITKSKEGKERSTCNKKWRNAAGIGHILRKNCSVEHVTEGSIERRIDEEEDVSSYRMTFRKKVFEVERGNSILQTSENSLKEAMNLSQDRLRNKRAQ